MNLVLKRHHFSGLEHEADSEMSAHLWITAMELNPKRKHFSGLQVVD